MTEKTTKKKTTARKEKKGKGFEDDNYIMRLVDPRLLTPYEKNSRKHSDAAIEALADSMLDVGFRRSVSVDNDEAQTILAGHKSVLAAIFNIDRGHKKFEQIPVLIGKDLTDAQRRAFIIAENRHNDLSEYDYDILSFELEWIHEEGSIDIESTGFDESFILDSSDDFKNPGEAEEVPESPQVAVCVSGDIWLLGDNRIMCGDPASYDHAELLIGKGKIDLAFSDPDEEVAQDFYQTCIAMKIKNFILWGGNIFTEFLPPSKCWVVWSKQQDGKSARGEMAWTSFSRGGVSVFKHSAKDAKHKPVGLYTKIFERFDGFQHIFDGFVGTGATLIACEELGRVCYGLDSNPVNIDICIKRWQDFTGKDAILESTGTKYNDVIAAQADNGS